MSKDKRQLLVHPDDDIQAVRRFSNLLGLEVVVSPYAKKDEMLIIDVNALDDYFGGVRVSTIPPRGSLQVVDGPTIEPLYDPDGTFFLGGKL